ncbi:hypothetical protein HPB48_015446 [Haemaphysalis longicornis]|uniref:Uncharacterized protein n=1 Tax=Haemaphysalis longicornis TaxID=44386 RepID=A0A9J6GA13_HAELO|nr:hypothetical protein HPB48_015446 [Haemaphysalis longicornis]
MSRKRAGPRSQPPNSALAEDRFFPNLLPELRARPPRRRGGNGNRHPKRVVTGVVGNVQRSALLREGCPRAGRVSRLGRRALELEAPLAAPSRMMSEEEPVKPRGNTRGPAGVASYTYKGRLSGIRIQIWKGLGALGGVANALSVVLTSVFEEEIRRAVEDSVRNLFSEKLAELASSIPGTLAALG